LASRGATTLGLFRKLGYDALDLVADPVFCTDLVGRFGVDAVRESFLTCAGSAVAVAGESAQDTLKTTPEMLLRSCRGHAQAAHAVLEQLLAKHDSETSNARIRVASPLASIPADVLLASRVRLSELAGMRLLYWNDLHDATPEQLATLGWHALALGGGR
jgi:hypothetical protein